MRERSEQCELEQQGLDKANQRKSILRYRKKISDYEEDEITTVVATL